MPFNIELNKTKPIIKLQVSRNTITVYFHGQPDEVIIGLQNWRRLESRFIETMPECNRNWVRGPDAPHVKRNHTTEDEVKYTHFHQEFTSEVTPEILRTYLTNLWKQQLLVAPTDQSYQFLTDANEVQTILDTFAVYYAEYENSAEESLFNEERTLTTEEEDEYQQALTASTRGGYSVDGDEIVMALLFHSIFGKRREGNELMLNPESTDENCLIM